MATSAVVLLIVVPAAEAQRFCEEETSPGEIICAAFDPPRSERTNLIAERLARYARIGANHRLSGLASYYSTSLDGTLTANGETYRNRRYTAAYLTLPLGCWIEVSARATDRKIRLRVNDRGPYVKKFCLDLSQAAARALGVDVAEDRHVDIRIIALPGEAPLE